MDRSGQVSAYIMGGAILGVWIYGLLWGFDPAMDWGAWFGWGVLGLVIAGALYIVVAVEHWVRLGSLIVIGVVMMLVLLGSIFESDPHMSATFVTALGGGMIAATLPRFQASVEASHATATDRLDETE